MTILSAQSIRDRVFSYPSLLTPFSERNKLHGVSYGLSSAGYDIRVAEGFTLQPGDFKLASSIEKFSMPDDLVAIVHDKSTWARLGLCVQNTVAEPGWVGYLTLELTNHSRQEISIMAGVGIAQVLFHLLDRPTHQLYIGKYQNQQPGPQPARFE